MHTSFPCAASCAGAALSLWFPFALAAQQGEDSRGDIRVEVVESAYAAAAGAQPGIFLTGQEADIVLGAKGFDNAGGPLLFNHPSGIATDGKALFVADRWNNRVLIWKSAPVGNTPPDLVLGQPDFTRNDSGAGPDQLNWPGNVAITPAGGRVAVADTNNDRVLIWTSFPAHNGQAADLVLDLGRLGAPGPGGPRGGGPGPWDSDVLVCRLGGGEPEKLATFARAGVPTLARLSDGRLVAAFQNFPEDDERNFDRVAVGFSSDEGRTWTQAQPIAVEGMEEGLARPFDPTLVPLPDGRVRLYFTSSRSPDFRRGAPAIYSAISKDGLHYEFEPGVRFALEGRVVIDCAAALHDGVFHLIVPDNGSAQEMMADQERRAPPRGGTGYHLRGTDGLNFERAGDVTIPGDGRWLGNMQSDGGQLAFFGTGGGLWPVASADGTAWDTAENAARVPGADPGAARLKGGAWLVAVTGPPRPGTPSAQR